MQQSPQEPYTLNPKKKAFRTIFGCRANPKIVLAALNAAPAATLKAVVYLLEQCLEALLVRVWGLVFSALVVRSLGFSGV